MKRIPKPNTIIPQPETKAPDILVSDVSVQRLIDSCLVALDREVRNILILSARGKLDPATARDLRDTSKLLFELKDREADSLKGLSDEELENLLNKRKEEHASDV